MATMANFIMKRFPGCGLRAASARGLAWVSLLLCAAFLLPGKAHAQSCSYGTSGTQNLTVTMPASAAVPRDAPAGTIIPGATYTLPATANSVPVGVNCSGSGSVPVVYANLMPGAGASANGIIPTGVPGIGYQIVISGNPVNTTPGVNYTVDQLNALCNPPATHATSFCRATP